MYYLGGRTGEGRREGGWRRGGEGGRVGEGKEGGEGERVEVNEKDREVGC